MAVDERARRKLYDEVAEACSVESADALMDYLPPVGWADIATKHDLDAQSDKLMAAFRAEINAAIFKAKFSLIGILLAFVGLVAAVLGLT